MEDAEREELLVSIIKLCGFDPLHRNLNDGEKIEVRHLKLKV